MEGRAVQPVEESVVHAAKVRRVPGVAALEEQVPVQEVGELRVVHRAADEERCERGLVGRQRQSRLVL